MKLIIDISDKTYEIIKNMIYFYNSQRSGKGITKEILTAIKQGTPLPKCHGRLIDADAYKEKIFRVFPCNDRDDQNIRRATEIAILNAPTIIEANKGDMEC